MIESQEPDKASAVKCAQVTMIVGAQLISQLIDRTIDIIVTLTKGIQLFSFQQISWEK